MWQEERGVLSWTGGRARGAFMFWQQEHLVTLSVDS